MSKILPYFMLVMALAAGARAARQESGFEQGDFSGWNTQGSGWSVYAKAASEGKKCAMVSVAKGEAAGLKAAAKPILGVEPGSVLKVELDVAGRTKTSSSSLTASVICVDAAGSALREVKKKVARPAEDFRTLKLPELVVPSGTAEAYLMLVVEVPAEARGHEWWRFDRVVFNVE